MKNNLIFTFFCTASIILYSCGASKNERTRKIRSDIVTSCVGKWVKQDLQEIHRVKVFHHQEYSIRYLGLVIGVNEKSDTIGLMYKHEFPKIEIGDSVDFRAEHWTDGERSQTVIIDISNDESVFWYCATKLIYYGRIGG